MPVETAEAPTAIETQVDQSQTQVQTETAETAVKTAVEERAAETKTEDAAVVQQVEVVEEKPDYMTRADWEREKAEVEKRAAADALEADRRRRQTENARKATAEKREAEERVEARDTVKAAFGAAGVYEIPDDAVYTAIDRVARKRADQLATSSHDTVEQAWDYLTAPAYGKQVDLDAEAETAASRLGPKLQHLVNTIRPAIEAEARKGYIAESELPARVQAEIARINAKANEGKPELVRVDGAPASTVMSWAAYNALSDQEKLAMPVEKRREIMAADAKRRSG